MYNDSQNRDNFSQQEMFRADMLSISANELRLIEEGRRINAEIQWLRKVFPYRFRNELERLRFIYKHYIESIDTFRIKKFAVSATKKLLLTLKRKVNRYNYHLILILKEQKRLQQKIKSLFLPVKIIPDSLRPINIHA